ncbi:MAG TPA: hypothetical protein VGM88_11655 [Kofleriaceae bacterium]|jgi:hypothetical protein
MTTDARAASPARSRSERKKDLQAAARANFFARRADVIRALRTQREAHEARLHKYAAAYAADVLHGAWDRLQCATDALERSAGRSLVMTLWLDPIMDRAYAEYTALSTLYPRTSSNGTHSDAHNQKTLFMRGAAMVDPAPIRAAAGRVVFWFLSCVAVAVILVWLVTK